MEGVFHEGCVIPDGANTAELSNIGSSIRHAHESPCRYSPWEVVSNLVGVPDLWHTRFERGVGCKEGDLIYFVLGCEFFSQKSI